MSSEFSSGTYSASTIQFVQSIWYQCSFGAPLWNHTILTPNSQICVAWMVSAPIMLRKSRCHTYGTPRTK